LFSFFIAMAILLGAEFNSAIEEIWPAHPTRRERRQTMARVAERAQPDSDRPDGDVAASHRANRLTRAPESS
jgi:membrane protein